MGKGRSQVTLEIPEKVAPHVVSSGVTLHLRFKTLMAVAVSV